MKQALWKIPVTLCLAAAILFSGIAPWWNGMALAESGEIQKESPMLAERVAAGSLPALEDRLPETPKLLNELAPEHLALTEGNFGGTIRCATGALNDVGVFLVGMFEPLVNSPSFTGEEFVANVAESYEVNEDGSVYTFTLRKGMKWSDGEPVTMEDVRFAIEDVLMNETLTPALPNMFRTGGKADGTPMTLEIVDDYTFRLAFDGPYPGFLLKISVQSWPSYYYFLKPYHYLSQYHEAYADPDALAQLVADGKYDSWADLFNDYDITSWEMGSEKAIGFPSLSPWVPISNLNGKITLERNAYYWKVDASGRQMPYVDYGEVYYVGDSETGANMIISGQVDYASNAEMSKMQLFKANEETGNYVTRVANYHGRLGNIYLNLNYDDADWQSVVGDVRFRKAISLSVDRADIVDTVFFGLGVLAGEIGYGDYDPDEANRLLDELGLDQKNADGIRLYPDGNTVDLLFEASSRVPENLPISEMLVTQLKAVGINAQVKTIDYSLWAERRPANQIQAFVERMETYWWMADAKFSYWAPLWDAWYQSNGETGIEPPEEVKTLMDYARDTTAVDLAEGPAIYQKLVDGIREGYWYIPIMDDSQMAVIFNKDLRNTEFTGDLTTIILSFSIEEMYYENPENH